MAGFLPIEPSKKLSLLLIITFASIAVIDTTIVKFVTYSGIEPLISHNVGIFILFSLGFTICGFILLNSVRKGTSKSTYVTSLNLKYFYSTTFAVHILMVTIIVLVILQMTLLNKYNLNLLRASTFLTHLPAVVLLLSLAYMFLGWFRAKHNYMIMLFFISLLLISANIVISIIYFEFHYSRSLNIDRKPYPIYLYVIRQEVTAWSERFHTVFDIFHVLSFFSLWIATVVLMNQYRYKFGKIKYFTVVSIPLFYYLFPLEAYFGNVFSPLALDSPNAFGMMYVLLFSATKQVGAVLFSLTFLTASTVVPKLRVRNSMLVSAIGIALVFGSIEITTLQYRLFPPFGLVTQAFIPVGSFLLFTGIFNSAIGVAQDAQLRKDFYKSTESQLSLFRTMGVNQMEKELVMKFKNMERNAIKTGSADEPYQGEEDIKQIVREVLNELNSNKKNKIEKSEP